MTRKGKGKGIEVLLLLYTMAAFASWLVSMVCETAGVDQWLKPFRSRRQLYTLALGKLSPKTHVAASRTWQEDGGDGGN